MAADVFITTVLVSYPSAWSQIQLALQCNTYNAVSNLKLEV